LKEKVMTMRVEMMMGQDQAVLWFSVTIGLFVLLLVGAMYFASHTYSKRPGGRSHRWHLPWHHA
jgi:hypothetical protein